MSYESKTSRSKGLAEWITEANSQIDLIGTRKRGDAGFIDADFTTRVDDDLKGIIQGLTESITGSGILKEDQIADLATVHSRLAELMGAIPDNYMRSSVDEAMAGLDAALIVAGGKVIEADEAARAASTALPPVGHHVEARAVHHDIRKGVRPPPSEPPRNRSPRALRGHTPSSVTAGALVKQVKTAIGDRKRRGRVEALSGGKAVERELEWAEGAGARRPEGPRREKPVHIDPERHRAAIAELGRTRPYQKRRKNKPVLPDAARRGIRSSAAAAPVRGGGAGSVASVDVTNISDVSSVRSDDSRLPSVRGATSVSGASVGSPRGDAPSVASSVGGSRPGSAHSSRSFTDVAHHEPPKMPQAPKGARRRPGGGAPRARVTGPSPS